MQSSLCLFFNEAHRRTCSIRMLLIAVWSSSDTSTVSIWLAKSWRLYRHQDGVKLSHKAMEGQWILTFLYSVKGNASGAPARSPRRCCWGCWWRCRRWPPRWESRWRTCCTPSPCDAELARRSLGAWRGQERTVRVWTAEWTRLFSLAVNTVLKCCGYFGGK